MMERNVPLAAWLGYWGAMRRYHRYEVSGIEHLERPGSALIVGYHGRPIAHDLCMLTVTLHERLGYLPHAIVHGAAEKQPLMRWVTEGLGFVTGDGEAMARAIARGEHVIVTPGGIREGCRSFLHRYQVDWGERTGYVRLALRHRLPIVPVAGIGTDDAFIGLNDGYALGKRLRAPARLPVWFGLGLGGLWPLSLPLPVKMRTMVGEPIDLRADGDVDPRDGAGVRRLHARVVAAVQGLLDAAREGANREGGGERKRA
nr:lysophospholipid acyltransferase family protein [Polyangium aurulentum]